MFSALRFLLPPYFTFRNVWNGAKTGATKTYGALKKGAQFVGRLSKPIANIATTAGGILGVLPGQIGLIGKALASGGNFIKSLTDSLPNSSVKDKINSAIDRGINYTNNATNRAQTFINADNTKVSPYIQAAPQISNKFGQYITDFVNR